MRQRERIKPALGKWRKLVSEQGRSGQSVAAFCRERQLRASHFYWWKKRLGASGAERFVEVKLATAAPTLGAAEDRRVEVVLRNGRSLRVGPGFDQELVRALAAVLESAA
jgi:hypothetical protein